ncbi:hypothetical protein KIN20_014456 [Parelaphostrongylus tenuis]|uniref:Uncharacterized protein n=1 Tax=Parelaphostrongylus tenuis TaxID=148309 RepID=A0AAD5MDR0_PARTN|nr:hypothetical protein KIN20_014456 [Parelaphostrongylus tenuis]
MDGENSLNRPIAEWLMLTAMLEESTTDRRTTDVIKTWMVLFEKRRVGDSEDEIMFLSSLAKVLAKKGSHLTECFAASEIEALHRYLLVTFVMLSELEYSSKLFEGAIKFVAKTASDDEMFEIFEFCFYELAQTLRGRFGILEIFLRDPCSSVGHKIESVMPTICAQLSYQLNSHVLSNAAGDFLAALVVRFPTSPDLMLLFIRNITHHVKSIHWNVLRWIGRIQVTRGSAEFLLSVRRAVSRLFQSSGIDDDLWPPCSWETEDVSCINPQLDDEEGEGGEVLWHDDLVLNAYLQLTSILNQRFGIRPSCNDPMIQSGMKWHLPEIRMIAFHLWTTCLEVLEDPKYHSVLEEFIICNASSSLTSLREAVNAVFISCKMSPEGETEYLKEFNNLQSKEGTQLEISYLPEEIRGATLPLPSPQSARETLEECLKISGSCDLKSCPEFDVLYANLDKAGWDQRLFARYVIDLIDLVRSHEDVRTSLKVISESVARCRLKVVVNYGCSVIDEILSTHRHDQSFFCLADHLYGWAINQLIDKKAESRTLALSRILWSTCEKFEVLLGSCFETFRTTLNHGSLDKRVHQRVLKTLKLFTSRADCKLPDDLVDFLFWHCIDVQTQSDFLLRSAATILFVPAFYIVSRRTKFWNGLIKRCSSLTTLPSLQRILLLSFLSRLSLGHVDCYSAPVLQSIHSLLVSLIDLLKVTPDLRERRFCLEILVAMSPVAAHEEMVKLLKKSHLDRVSRVDYDFLVSTIRRHYEGTNVIEDREVPHDLLQSPFVKIITKCETCDPGDGLRELNQMFSCVEPHSAELSLQAIAMAMTRIAKNMGRME